MRQLLCSTISKISGIRHRLRHCTGIYISRTRRKSLWIIGRTKPGQRGKYKRVKRRGLRWRGRGNGLEKREGRLPRMKREGNTKNTAQKYERGWYLMLIACAKDLPLWMLNPRARFNHLFQSLICHMIVCVILALWLAHALEDQTSEINHREYSYCTLQAGFHVYDHAADIWGVAETRLEVGE